MKKIYLYVLAGLGVIPGLFFMTVVVGGPIAFESQESVTETGAPVFNQVEWHPGWKQDIWLMRQSHHGFNGAFSDWDRLAIVVDKTQTPAVASFYQLPSGEMNFPGAAAAIPFKARCYACHVNGPRVVRAKFDSSAVRLTPWNRVRLAAWGLRIKIYGQVKSVAGAEFSEGAPFHSTLKFLAEVLPFKSCTKCHAEGGIRGPLRFEHLGTVNFMVKNGIMPPFPFSLRPEERNQLQQLIRN